MKTTFDEMFAVKDEQGNVKAEATINRMDAIIKSARECLNIQQFHEYKAKFVKEEAEMMSVMIAYTNAFVLAENANPTMYAMRMAMFIQKVYDLRRLLKSVEQDSQRKT